MNTWQIDSSYNGLLFFAQLSEELLFHFSHDSFKVPTLNFHFLCVEASSVIRDIEQGILENGNITPIINEFESTFQSDPIAASFYGNEIDAVFASKNEYGAYKEVFKEIKKEPKSEASIKKFKDTVEYLLEDLSRNDRYYAEGTEQLKKLVTKTNLCQQELELIKQYTRAVLSELINIGYSEEYIYSIIKTVFSNEQEPFDSADEKFNSFLSYFSLKKKNYIVYLPISNLKLKEDLSAFPGLAIAENVFEMFGGKPSYILKMDYEAYDQDSAVMKVLNIIDFCTSLTQYVKHCKRSYSYKYAEVVDAETKESFHLKAMTQPFYRQRRTPSDVHEYVNSSLVSSLFDAISLHSSAFNSKDMNNQLLDLWTAMEVLFPVERNGSYSKINQISNSASTILSYDHIRELIKSLDSELKDNIGEDYAEHILTEDIPGKADEEKLLSVIVLDEFEDQYKFLDSKLLMNPLCAYKLHHYKEEFSSPKGVVDFYKRHSIRLTWQIMRIYRSRNLIIHDGTTWPFLPVILQNLHFYIDTIIDTFCKKCNEGFTSPTAIIALYSGRERQHLKFLESLSTIEKSNYLEAILGA